MDDTASAISNSTCYWCGTAEGDCDAELFIVHDESSGVCDRCVGYLMSVLATDNRPQFERYVDEARGYSDNCEAARLRRDAAKRLI